MPDLHKELLRVYSWEFDCTQFNYNCPGKNRLLYERFKKSARSSVCYASDLKNRLDQQFAIRPF